jgi:hypothetical protein
MGIEKYFTQTIYIQEETTGFGGAKTWEDKDGSNKGYIRVLSQNERASVDKPTLFSTHRVVMTKTVSAAYGNRIRIGTSYYMVKGPNPQLLSGGNFVTVDCEVVT